MFLVLMFAYFHVCAYTHTSAHVGTCVLGICGIGFSLRLKPVVYNMYICTSGCTRQVAVLDRWLY